MKNGELRAFKHAQTIIEYALTAAEAKAAHTARQLAKEAPSLKWYQKVEVLRKYMLQKGLVLDDAFWKMPVKPPASLSRVRPRPRPAKVQPALAGTGLGEDKSFWAGTGGDILKTIGTVTIAGIVLYGLYWMISKEDAKQDNKRRYRAARKKAYTKFPGLVGT